MSGNPQIVQREAETGLHGTVVPARCPECGWKTSSAIPRRSPWHWRTLLPGFVALLGAVTLATWIARTPSRLTIGSGQASPGFVQPTWTRDHVEAVAAGGAAGTGLFDAVIEVSERWGHLSAVPGQRSIEFAFVAPDGDRNERRNFGWPVPWWSRVGLSRWEDPVAQTGFKALVTDTTAALVTNINQWISPDGLIEPRPRWWWQYGSLWHRPSVESTGGELRWSTLYVTGIVGTLGLLAIAWAAAAVVVWVMNVNRARRGRRMIGPWPARIVAGVAMLACAVLAIATTDHRETLTPNTRSIRGWSGGGRIGLNIPSSPPVVAVSMTQLEARSTDVDRDRWLAKQLLLCPVSPGASTTRMLAARCLSGTRMSGTMDRFNDRVEVLTITEEKYLVGEYLMASAAAPGGTRWSFTQPHLRIAHSTGSGNDPTTVVTIDVSMVGTLALIVACVWLVPMVVDRSLTAVTLRRRRRENCCLACGHGLGPPRAAT